MGLIELSTIQPKKARIDVFWSMNSFFRAPGTRDQLLLGMGKRTGAQRPAGTTHMSRVKRARCPRESCTPFNQGKLSHFWNKVAPIQPSRKSDFFNEWLLFQPDREETACACQRNPSSNQPRKSIRTGTVVEPSRALETETYHGVRGKTNPPAASKPVLHKRRPDTDNHKEDHEGDHELVRLVLLLLRLLFLFLFFPTHFSFVLHPLDPRILLLFIQKPCLVARHGVSALRESTGSLLDPAL